MFNAISRKELVPSFTTIYPVVFTYLIRYDILVEYVVRCLPLSDRLEWILNLVFFFFYDTSLGFVTMYFGIQTN